MDPHGTGQAAKSSSQRLILLVNRKWTTATKKFGHRVTTKFAKRTFDIFNDLQSSGNLVRIWHD
jgi:hypothetical protein